MQVKKMSELFKLCAYDIKYQQVGDDVNYAFMEEKDTLYIFFEASNGKKDWFFNFFFAKKVYKQFRVHRGFLHCYNQVRDIVLDKIYSKPYKSVIVVGYSHGGALATICHEDVKYHFPNIDLRTYAFESPRAIKTPKKYRSMWEGLTITRVGTDLITHLPPKLFGFDDVGEMLKLKGDPLLVDKCIPKCIKYHYPQVVLQALKVWEYNEDNF